MEYICTLFEVEPGGNSAYIPPEIVIKSLCNMKIVYTSAYIEGCHDKF